VHDTPVYVPRKLKRSLRIRPANGSHPIFESTDKSPRFFVNKQGRVESRLIKPGSSLSDSSCVSSTEQILYAKKNTYALVANLCHDRYRSS
jgi:hypothetical protein